MTGSGTEKLHHLLLATDFSARCDRAQDRAVQLALQWDARLTAVHAIDATDVPNDLPSRQGRPNAVERAKRLLEEEFAATEGLRASVHVEQGKPKKVILDVATKQHCDLIVTGIAGNEPLGQSFLGSTVTALTRSAKVPVLVVKKRVLETNERVVVASDLSEASRRALDLALALFETGPRTRRRTTKLGAVRRSRNPSVFWLPSLARMSPSKSPSSPNLETRRSSLLTTQQTRMWTW